MYYTVKPTSCFGTKDKKYSFVFYLSNINKGENMYDLSSVVIYAISDSDWGYFINRR